jgi:hypothetical protein
MATASKASPGAVAACITLSAFSLLLWILLLPSLANVAGSDAAGNALAQAYAAIATIVLWVLLAVLVLIGGIKGAIPLPGMVVAAILVPASGYATMEALELLSRPHQPPHLWPIIIPALIPPLIVAYSFWALLPSLRATINARVAGALVWGGTFILCIAIVPLAHIRYAADDRATAALEKFDADYASLPVTPPMWDLVPFLETRNTTKQQEVLARIRALDRRQNEAELMLDRGDFPLGYLGRLDLTPTQALCDKARNLLRQRVEPLVLTTPNSKPYTDIGRQVFDAANAVEWLIGHDCPCDAEARAWETMANAYRGSDWNIHRLRELREPKNLGRIVRMHPERFSMLTPKAHLKAWLSFADKQELRDQALEGARKLDHRTADAVEMLTGKHGPGAPWALLKYLPVLDLDATEPLCDAALRHVRDDIAKVYRPRADDPRRYDELLSRLGAGEPLTALKWLAEHGCNVEAELSDAEDVVRTYQDSPDRAAMLASLARLHRKP